MKFFLAALVASCSVIAAESQLQNLKGCVAPGEFETGRDYFPEKVRVTESVYWDIQYFDTYKILRNELAGETYVLYQCGTEPPASESGNGHVHFIPVPLQNGIALSSTTHIPHLELLGLRTEIKAWLGWDGYISSPCLKELIGDESTIVVSDTSDQSAVDSLKETFGPNIVAFHNYRDHSSNLFNVTVSAYQEQTNEAIFEWNKFFAVFFNLELKATELFYENQRRYQCYAEEAVDIVDVADSGVKPTLLWATYTNYTGVDAWNVAQCPNYYCEYAELCAADFVQSRDGTIDYYGSKLFTTEAFVQLAKDADHWIYASANWEEAYEAYGTQLDQFVSVQNQQVFDTEGAGSNAWFENRLAEYDVVLQDVCSVVGTADPLHRRVWMRNIFTEEKGQAIQQCLDPTAPLVTRATDCRAVVVVYPAGFSCFSGENYVDVKNGGSVQMKDVQIGDLIKTAEGSYSRVYSFGHYDPEVEATYLQIFTKMSLDKPLEISADHMVFVGKQAVPAGSAKVGDNLLDSNGENAEIVNIKSVIRKGAYAPFTESGSIVVNDIVASNYISFEQDTGDISIGGINLVSYQWVAHLAQAPHRLYCSLVSSCENESYTKEGLSLWVAGPFQAAHWWLGQNAVVKSLTLVPALVFLACISAAEMLVKSPWVVALVVAFVLVKKGGKVKQN